MGAEAPDRPVGLSERAFEDEAAGLPARRFAFSLVTRVLGQAIGFDEASAALATVAQRMPDRDAAFGRAIAYAALRHKGSLERVIGGFLDHPLPAHGEAAGRVLLCGAAELLVLEGKAHATVDGANRLAVAVREAKPFKALVNAVLRRVAQEGHKAWAALDRPRADTPDWLWQRWHSAYGDKAAREIAAAHGAQAALDVTPRRADEAAAIAAELGAEPIGAGSLRLTDAAPVETLPGYGAGAWWVQDAAAAIPARVLLDLSAPGAAMIDLCAAPGGKTLQLAAAGRMVSAVDSSAARLKRLRENLARTGLSAQIVTADARVWRPDAPAGAVLLDAPCSATGTIRRHPELPWIRDERAVTRNAAAARDLLDAAWQMTAEGGVLVFAVCSLEPEEGERQLEAFLGRHRGAICEAIAAARYGLPGWAQTPSGALRILPSMLQARGGLDGFFVAALRREAP